MSVLAGSADFATAFSEGRFSAPALAAVASMGFSAEHAALVARRPIGGRLGECEAAWRLVSDSSWVLGIIKAGYKVRWAGATPHTPHRGGNPPTDEAGKAILDQEVLAMLEKGAIRLVEPSQDEVVSGFFARPKKTPGKWRPIVSLKYTNKFIVYEKFRMTTTTEIRRWIRPNFFFASIDLTDAYFCIPLHKSVWRFTRFKWRGLTYEYMVIMFGLGPSARVFTKMLRPALRFLKEQGIEVVAYIDDLLVQAPDAATCARHAEIVVLVLQCLGYGINFAKSSLEPARVIEHLGFIWDSRDMTVSLPQAKTSKIAERAAGLLSSGSATAGEMRSFLGTLESTRLAAACAPLHYRGLQYQMPRHRRGRPFPCRTVISFRGAARADLDWWARAFPTLHTSSRLLARPTTLEVWTDASGLVGWGGHSSRGQQVQGRWEEEQMGWHINLKEILAAKLSLDGLMEEGDTVALHMDSTTAVSFVNRMGGTRSRLLCSAAKSLWDLVLARKGWIRAHWVPRERNEQADLLSKFSLAFWDFGLLEEVASDLWDRWRRPSTDLFASSAFHLAAEYFSCNPDPGAAQVDAFAVSRWPHYGYAFPPPPLLAKTLERIAEQQIRVILVAPRWTAATWWDTLTRMTVEGPILLGRESEVCRPLPGKRLPRLGMLVACLVEGAPPPSRS